MKDLDANLIIAIAPDPVFVSDLQGKILVANDAVSELLGFRKDEVLEQSLSRFISVDETREFRPRSVRWWPAASPEMRGSIRGAPPQKSSPRR